MMLNCSAFAHRNAHSALIGNLDSPVISGICVADNAHSWVGYQYARKLLSSQVGAVGNCNHSGMNTAANSHTTAMVDTHPRRAARCVDKCIE
jgi:hypothetical protein